MSHKIRLFEESDYDEVVKLWKASGIKLTLSDDKQELFKLVFKEQNRFFLLVEGNKIIGVIICAFDGRRGYIHHLAILPEFQHQGLGKLLLNHAMDYYTKLDAVKVHIFIENDNLNVMKFYQKMDWRIRDDIVLMTKTLRENE